MSLLLVNVDLRRHRILEAEATELDVVGARREVMRRNDNGLTRPTPHVVWQARELGEIAQPAPSVRELISNLEEALIDARKARVA